MIRSARVAPKNPFLRGSDLLGEFLPVGHRGARGLAPECTLEGYRLGIELGVRMIEVDVRLTRDGVPVTFHDHHLRRCTDAVTRYPDRAPWLLADFTWDELRVLDAGSWFAAKPPLAKLATDAELATHLAPEALARFGGGAVRVPTLEETLELLEASDVYTNIELKSLPYYPPFLGAEVLRLVKRMGLGHRVLFSSFDHELMRELKRAAPEVACGVLSSERLATPVDYLVGVVGADTLHPGARPAYDTLGVLHYRTFGVDIHSRLLARLRGAGLGVYAWTLDNPGDITLLRDAGVSGIMSDFPHRLDPGWIAAHGHEVRHLQVE